MSGFEVIRRGRDGEAAFASYLYEIRQSGRRVAEFRHSCRNDGHEIRRSSLGQWEEFDDILEGGGPQPLQVSPSGAEALSRYLWERLGVDWNEFHPSARELIPDYRLWDSGDDFSPNGNDTGFDALLLVGQESSNLKASGDDGRSFYKGIWEAWGFSWPPDQKPSDEIEYNMHREFVVGLAFSFLKVFGRCPAWLRTSAMGEIERYQTYLEHAHEDWKHRQEALEMQALMYSTLSNAL